MMEKFFLTDAQATFQFGFQLGQTLPPGSVILLEGDLGAGKTTLVQGLGSGLEITESIVSPTFTLVNEYIGGRIPLYHLDLYRLQPHEVRGIYPEIYWEGREVKPGITAIEWAQRLPYHPKSFMEIELVNLREQGREAIIRGN